tara:strand:- start:104 stop:469 length:366 start_codon:yes stop_codon:yes gene_type:complete
MANSSVGTVVSWGGDSSAELRSVNMSNDAASLVDITTLGSANVKQLIGQNQNATFTVTTLDEPSNWAVSQSGDSDKDLEIQFAGASATDFGKCLLVSKSIDLGIDAAIEFTFVFEQSNAGT